MACAPQLYPGCVPLNFCTPENFSEQFPSLRGPMGPPGGPGLYVANLQSLRLLDASTFPAGYVANVAGHTNINDGGGGDFIYSPASTAGDNDGTIVAPQNTIGRWVRVYSGDVNIVWFGAIGDGTTDNYDAIIAALQVVIDSEIGCLYVPPGDFFISQALSVGSLVCKISVRGDGPNVSVLRGTAGAGIINFTFSQDGITQPYGLNLMDIGFRCTGNGSTAIVISYGDPLATNDHYEPSTIIRNVVVASGASGSWGNGIYIQAAWNVCMTDVFVSGNSQGAVWENLSGAGIQFDKYCVNSHLVNVHCNFFANGFYYNAGTGGNTEGLFFSNCSMVAVKKGVYVIGNAGAPAPRMSTITWTGGLIELRITGVTTGSAAFHLVNVWTALVTSVQMITESITTPPTTYGFFLDGCAGVVVNNCDINAFIVGLWTANTCKAINSYGNTYTNCATQNVFNVGTSGSRSYGHVYFNNAPNDLDPAGVNKLGFID